MTAQHHPDQNRNGTHSERCTYNLARCSGHSRRPEPSELEVRGNGRAIVRGLFTPIGVQCFADELAHLAGRDPYDYLMDLIGPPRILDLNGADYPNYNAPYKRYPIDTTRLRRVLARIPNERRLGPERSQPVRRNPRNS